MQRIMVSGIAGIVALVCSVWAWMSVIRAITVATASDWLVPGCAISIVAIAVLVAIIIAPTMWEAVGIGALIGATAWIVAPHIHTLLAVPVGGILLGRGWVHIHESMNDHVHLRVRTHVREGGAAVIGMMAGIVTIIAYVTIVRTDAAALIFGDVMRSAFDSPIAQAMLPAPMAYGTGPNGTATVDDFLRNTVRDLRTQEQGAHQNLSLRFMEDYAHAVQTRVTEIVPHNLRAPSAAVEIPQDVLDRMRADLSMQVGMTLTGSESVRDVFVVSMQHTVRQYAEQKLPAQYTFPGALAAVIAFFLFISLWWIGSLLRIFWGIGAQGVIAGLCAIGVIRRTTESVLQERLA